MTCLRYLARQGLALRGHDSDEGNLKQLLVMLAEGDDILKLWFDKHQDYTSPAIQNEMLSLISRAILQSICKEICTTNSGRPLMFSLIIDGTRDISGVEQESICLRYVNADLQPMEVFVGLYEAQSTTGESISNIALDAMLRLGLPLENLRGQSYDGAANMSGAFNGAKALIQKKQPLATFIHCSAHCINLVTESAIAASSFVRDALDLVNELGALSSQSGKFQSLFKTAAVGRYEKAVSLRPLCPT